MSVLPRDWSMTKVKYLASYMNGYPFAPTDWEDGGKPIVRIQNLTDPEASWNTTTLDVPQCYTVEAGDILISWSASLGVYVWEREPALLNQHIFKAIPTKEVERRYFVWAAKWFVGELQSQAHGSTMQHLTKDVFGGFAVPLPPKAEQARIANFLDEQTARIDALIAEKERLDALLGEYREAVITQAVTKGLDPSMPMKDSGIAWLGAVPEHWECWKLSHAFGRIGSGTTPPTDQQEWYEDGNIPWITTGELRENRIEQTAKYVTTAALGKFSALQVFPPESLAIAMYGATIGRLGILGTDATTNQACCVLSSPDHLVVPFVFFWLRAFRQALISLFATGGGQPNISQDSVASLRVPAPSLKEQAAIANFLDEQTARVDALREHCKGHIKLLREYRSSLISAAVTGQLDVDGFKSGLS